MIEPLLRGADDAGFFAADDLQYVRDLGLVARDNPIRIANPIYREVVPRDLTFTTQAGFSHDPAWYVGEGGALEVGKLLAAFQEFFREHSEHWVERFQYKEAGPQLLLQAFLQRILNSGGRIEREYGLGRLRTDLLLVWPLPGDAGGMQKAVIECKVLHRGLERTLRRGAGADAGLHGPLRVVRRTSGDLRPHRGQVLGGEGLPPRRDRRRGPGHGLGDVRRESISMSAILPINLDDLLHCRGVESERVPGQAAFREPAAQLLRAGGGLGVRRILGRFWSLPRARSCWPVKPTGGGGSLAPGHRAVARRSEIRPGEGEDAGMEAVGRKMPSRKQTQSFQGGQNASPY